MKNYTLLHTIRRVAIFLAIAGLMGASSVVLGQKNNDPTPTQSTARMDFTGDGQDDMVFGVPGTNKWVIQSPDGIATSEGVGVAGDRPVAADYDGDKIVDRAVAHDKDGSLVWQIKRSSDGAEVEFAWGLSIDTTVQGDYDGDGMADAAVWRAKEATFYILLSKSGVALVIQWGLSTDKPMPGDFDGNGTTDVCVFRPRTSSFFYTTGPMDLLHEQVFGPFETNKYVTFVLADYDGDGQTDFATFDPINSGSWMILDSSTGKYRSVSLAGSTQPCNPFTAEPCSVLDFAIPADYDGDGKVDPATWDSVNGIVNTFASTRGLMKFTTQTTNDMLPISTFFMSN